MVHLDESNETIMDTSCDCTAGASVCKYTVVVLYWLLKRSDAPSTTSVQCYWTKPNLKRARDNSIICKDFAKGKVPKRGPKDPTLLERLRKEAINHANCRNSLLMAYDPNSKMEKYCLFDMTVEFLEKEKNPSYDKYKKYEYYDDLVIKNKANINRQTKGQVNSKQWHNIRQARLTGSKIYESVHCRTPNGSLVEQILGGCKAPETKAMKRGKNLENRVLNQLKTEINEEIGECGFIAINGIFGASPDGIGDDFVVEIKCPISEKTKKNYIKDGEVGNKHMGQVQLEMLAAGKTKCLFCVADQKYESNGKIEIININFDQNYIQNLMRDAEEFSKLNEFPIIMKSAST